MIKLGPMKIGIRKIRFHQFDLRWGDTLVDGWDSFVGWVHVQRLSPYLRPLLDSPAYSVYIRDAASSDRVIRDAFVGNNFCKVIVKGVYNGVDNLGSR